MKLERLSGFLLPAAGFLSGILITLLFLAAFPAIRQEESQSGGVDELVIIPPEINEATAQPTPLITAAEQDSGEVFMFTAGELVLVTGTGDQGLRLREYPSLGSSILHLAEEEEQYRVVGGPVEADGYVWWFVEHETDPGRRGWGVEDYLDGIND